MLKALVLTLWRILQRLVARCVTQSPSDQKRRNSSLQWPFWRRRKPLQLWIMSEGAEFGHRRDERGWYCQLNYRDYTSAEKLARGVPLALCVRVCVCMLGTPIVQVGVTLFDRRDTRPPHRAQNFVWQYEQRWPQPSANLVLWHIPQVGASLFWSWAGLVSSPIFLTCSLYDSNCWCNFLQANREGRQLERRDTARWQIK